MSEEMKATGIQWIGDIPASWNTKRIKYMARLKGRIGWQGLTSEEYQDEGAYLITGVDFKDGVIDWENCYRVPMKRWEEAKEIQIQNGDLLITKDGTIGKVAIVSDMPGEASLNSGVLRIMPIEGYSQRFLYWVIQSEEFWNWFNFRNAGNSTIIHLYQGDFAEFNCAFPDRTEQEDIADYLDEQCEKLDEIIADLEKQIDILQKYKKSEITEAVTKGLNKDAVVKNSGVEWIGKIPEHWDVKRLKYLCRFKTGGTPPDKYGINDDEGHPWITAPDISEKMIISNYSQYISDEAIRNCGYKLFPPNSILLVCIASVGKLGFITEESYANQQITAIMPKSFVVPKYLLYFIDAVCHKIIADASSNVVPIVNTGYLSNILCLLPPENEQKSITEHLDEEISKTDDIIAVKNKMLESIKKHKASLIFEYVTGRKRVKEVM